jgi:hypothetical protein
MVKGLDNLRFAWEAAKAILPGARVKDIPVAIGKKIASNPIKAGIILGLALVAIPCSLSGIAGVLAIIGGHWANLAAWNAMVSSAWSGMPYLLTAPGAIPVLLAAITVMVYIAWKVARGVYKKQNVKKEQELEKSTEIKIKGSTPKDAPYRVEGAKIVRNDGKSFKVHRHESKKVDGEEYTYYGKEVAEKLGNNVFIYQDSEDEMYVLYKQVTDKNGKKDMDLRKEFELKDLLTHLPEGATIITDINKYHKLVA